MKRFAVYLTVAFLIVCIGLVGFAGKAQAAVVFYSGFEMSDFTEWDTIVGSVAVQEVIKYTGGYAMRCNPSGGGSGYVYGISTGGRVSVYLYIASASNDLTRIIGHSGVNLVNVRLTTDRYLKLYNYGTQKGSTGLTQLLEDTWYRISVSLDFDAADDPAIVYINGSEEISANTDGGTGIADRVGVIAPVTAEFYFDDYAMDSTSSTNDLGDVRVARASPNLAGTYTQYDTSSGYTNVDEIPASDVDFIEDNQGNPVRESYNIPDLASLAGASSGDTVNAVSVWIRGDRDGGGATDHKAMVRDDSSDYESSNFAFDGIAWFNWYLAVMPKDSAAWSEARLNALEIGAYHSGGQDQRVHCLVAMVAYTSSVVGADISNTPSSKAFGVVAVNTTYWSSDSEPTWPLVDGDAYFTVTNNSSGSVSIAYKATNFTGGVGWTLTTGSPGENTVRMSVFIEGDGSGDGDALTTGDQTLISSLGASSDTDWEIKFETGTFTDPDGKTSTVTLTGTLL